jgi:hypothetical protein
MRNDLDGIALIFSLPFPLENVLVNLSGRPTAVPRQHRIGKAFVMTEIECSRSIPREAQVNPFPSELTTPPVTKMYFDMRGDYTINERNESRERNKSRNGAERNDGITSNRRHYTAFHSGLCFNRILCYNNTII